MKFNRFTMYLTSLISFLGAFFTNPSISVKYSDSVDVTSEKKPYTSPQLIVLEGEIISQAYAGPMSP